MEETRESFDETDVLMLKRVWAGIREYLWIYVEHRLYYSRTNNGKPVEIKH